MKSTLALPLTVAMILASTAAVSSSRAQSAPAGSRADDEAAIRKNDEAFIKAFDDGDARALAATFTDDAEVIDEDGNMVEGRESITSHFAAGFETSPGAKIKLKTDSVKFLGPDTAIVRGKAEVIPAAKSMGEPEFSRYTVVFVKRDGRWLQSSVRDEHDPAVSHADRLKALEWLVGDWVSESADSVVKTHCEWSENRSYLIRSFTVRTHGKPAMTGQQRIGWDPMGRQFKSWVFDSEGGFGEGSWSHDGEQWLVKAHGVRADGRPASVTNMITRVNPDMIRWRSIDRSVAGKSAPEIDEFVLVREPTKP